MGGFCHCQEGEKVSADPLLKGSEGEQERQVPLLKGLGAQMHSLSEGASSEHCRDAKLGPMLIYGSCQQARSARSERRMMPRPLQGCSG